AVEHNLASEIVGTIRALSTADLEGQQSLLDRLADADIIIERGDVIMVADKRAQAMVQATYAIPALRVGTAESSVASHMPAEQSSMNHNPAIEKAMAAPDEVMLDAQKSRPDASTGVAGFDDLDWGPMTTSDQTIVRQIPKSRPNTIKLLWPYGHTCWGGTRGSESLDRQSCRRAGKRFEYRRSEGNKGNQTRQKFSRLYVRQDADTTKGVRHAVLVLL
ncbi:hypothetical protein QFC22_006534, partial [Naganishia vaughanmartiniae]